MIQLILHLIGDYLTQSHWMATNKTQRFWPAAVHAIVYSLPFLLLHPSLLAFAVILVTHFFIDRYRLARFVVWFKNQLLSPAGFDLIIGLRALGGMHPVELDESELPQFDTWEDCKATGYPSAVPAWLSVWLLIAADNVLHLVINFCALRWL